MTLRGRSISPWSMWDATTCGMWKSRSRSSPCRGNACPNSSEWKNRKGNSMSKVWLIRGAGRGMGLDIATAALAAGHKVVATGRNIQKVSQAVGESTGLLVVKLDVTNPSDAESALKSVID